MYAAYWRVLGGEEWTWEAEEPEIRDGWLAAAQAAITDLAQARRELGEARAAERERIRQMAIETRAVTVSQTGRMMPFGELLRHSPEENAELLLQVVERARGEGERDACREHNAAIAVQLDQYRDERDEHAAQLQDIHDALAAAWPGQELTEDAEAILVAALIAERDKAREELRLVSAQRDELFDRIGDLQSGQDHGLAAKVLAVIARYKDDQVNALTAFADIMDAAGEAQ
jgi:hypothetical protein